MGEAVDRPVIWGQSHRYQLGPALGERTFWASDETGRAWAVEIGRAELLHAREELLRQLPQGTLPRMREIGDMPGGRLAYVVSEWLAGYTLGNLLHEGRRMAPMEIRRLGYDIAQQIELALQHGAEVVSVRPADLLYATAERRWRLLSPGEWRHYEGGPIDLTWLAVAMLGAGGSVPGEEPPWAQEDQKLWQLLQETMRNKWQVRQWSRRLRPLHGIMRALGGGMQQP
ncbi:MAG: hypothetical protein M0Z66_09030 [Thermaerobacter sp.]|nr:hypothetical protein [Thermaerobacter sp.]